MGRIPKFCTKCGEPLQTFTPEPPPVEEPVRTKAPAQNASADVPTEHAGGFSQNASAGDLSAPPPTNEPPIEPPPPIEPTPPIEPPVTPAGKSGKRRNPVVWIVPAAIAVVALLVAAFFTVHIWKDADCENPETCAICGKTRGKALGHDWEAASCTEAKTCSRCGAEVGDALGHDWLDATCTDPKTCSRCGETEGEALGHDWQDATYDAPKTCSRCGETSGHVLGWVGKVGVTVEDSDTTIGSGTGHAMVFEEPLVGVRKLTVKFTLVSYTGDPFGQYAVYAHSAERGWYAVEYFQVTSNDVNKQLVVPVTFSDTPTIDKILILSQKNATFTTQYSLGISDIQIS